MNQVRYRVSGFVSVGLSVFDKDTKCEQQSTRQLRSQYSKQHFQGKCACTATRPDEENALASNLARVTTPSSKLPGVSERK